MAMIAYLLKLTICWTVSYLGYTLLLRPTTFFQLNRIYLLGAFILSFFIPLLPWPELFPSGSAGSPAVIMLPVVSTAPEDIAVFIQAAAPQRPAWQWALYGVYGLGAAVFLFRLAMGVFLLLRWRMRATRERFPGFELLKTQDAAQPFSFFRWLYWPQHMDLSQTEGRQIIEHEAAHIRQWHSLDLLLVELVSAALWFHPLPWFYSRALRNVHEYLADAAALRQGSRKAYGRLLIRQALLGTHLPLVHNFSPALLKKRIHMMTKQKTRPKALLRYLMLAPLPLLIGMAMSRTPEPLEAQIALPEIVSDSIPAKVDVMPMYAAAECQSLQDQAEKEKCAMTALAKYLGAQLRYPESARKQNIQGMVVVSFVVDENGLPAQVKVVKDVGGGCGTEAMRVLETTRWTPGMHQGKPVKVEMKLPVAFRLPEEAPKKTEPVPAQEKDTPVSAADEIFTVVEEMPLFPGCESVKDAEERRNCSNQKLFEFIGRQLKYPEQARADSIQGMAVVEFIIDKTGAVKDAKIIRDLAGGCGEEALRVVNLMPKWTPGKQRGQLVNVQFRLPLQFKLTSAHHTTISAPSLASPAAKEGISHLSYGPNPGNGLFDLSFEGAAGAVNIKVFNTNGQTVYQRALDQFDGAFKGQIDLRNQPKGTYVLQIQQGEKIFTNKLVIQ